MKAVAPVAIWSDVPVVDATQEGRSISVLGGAYSLTQDSGRLPLQRFRQALATVETTALNWWAIGDSITEGGGASILDNSYPCRLTRALQKQVTAAGRGGFGYLPTYLPSFSGPSGSNNYWTFSGGGSNTTSSWLFGSGRFNFGTSATATLTFTGTSFIIHHRVGDATAVPFTVTVDGGSPVTVTPSTTGGATPRGVYTSAVLTRGVHTVVLAPTGATSMVIFGATLFDGDETGGIHTYANGVSGATSTVVLAGQASASAILDQAAVAPNPALVTIHLGTNDSSGATLQSNLASIIANVKAACTLTPSFVIFSPARTTSINVALSAAFDAAVRAVTAADPANVTSVILSDHFITAPTVGNSYVQGIFSTDAIHPSDAGHAFTAQLALGRLLGLHRTTDPGESALAEVVTLTGAQSVAGVKTFTSSPIVPTPSGTTEAANKAYADSATPDASTGVKGKVQLAGDLGGTAASPTTPTAVHITGAETIAGVKAFSSSPTVPTPVSGPDVVNKTYADGLVAGGTPDADATTKGKLQLTGDLGGTAASPTVPALVNKAPKLTSTATKTSAYAAVSGDLVIADGTSSGFTVTAPAAVAGATFAVRKTDASANRIVIAAAGADVFGIVSTGTTINLDLPGQTHVFVGVSGAWLPVSVNLPLPQLDLRYGRLPDVQVFTSSGTWTKPAGAVMVTVTMFSGGSGGGSGRRGAAASVRTGGGGGAGASRELFTLPASTLGATEAVVVGVGGAGGAAVTVDSTSGNAGGSGGISTFGPRAGSIFVARSAAPTGGAAGGTGAATGGVAASWGLGAGSNGGASSATGAGGSTGIDSTAACSGGGGGGGITSADAANVGAGGGRTVVTQFNAAGGAATGANGAAGYASDANAARPGGGGGGGGGATAAAGGNGGVGGIYGGGGGGGGASVNGNNSGAGGDGGAGIVLVISQ